MGETTAIEWCSHTFNPWRGCTKVSDGCKFCYADKWSERNPATLGVWGPKGTRVVAAESYWKQPLKWNRDAQAAGERRRVFCASLADVFEGSETMPAEAWLAVCAARDRLFSLIEQTPELDWLLLTKRPEKVMYYVPVRWHVEQNGFPANVWIGTSVEDQAAADTRMPYLRSIPAAVRFLSCEPLLGPVDLDLTGIHWVIAGGESGPNARPMHTEWARSLRDQCEAAGVPFLFKQWGEWTGEYPGVKSSGGIGRHSTHYETCKLQHDGKVFNTNNATSFHAPTGSITMHRAGKKTAGRLLDGRLHDGYPVVKAT